MSADQGQREKVIKLLFKDSVPLNDNKSLVFEILEFPDSGRVLVLRKYDCSKSERHAFNLGKLYLSYASFLLLKDLINSVDLTAFESIMRKTEDVNTSMLLTLLNKSSISPTDSIEDAF